MHVPVLVVGAGPVGLALAGDLGSRGIRCLVVEKTNGTITQPKMDLVGVRTMEFCRRWGIVDWVENSPYPRDYRQDYVYVTSLTGYELDRESFPTLGEATPPPVSPQRRERCPQDMFDPILRRFAGSFPTVSVEYETEFIDCEDRGDDVLVHLRDTHTGEIREVTASYVVGCDGAASQVRTMLGIGMTGQPALTYTTNVVFRCPDLVEHHDKGKAYRFICIGPEGTYATIVAINGADRWRLSHIGDSEKRTLTEPEVEDLIVRVVGKPIDFEILTIVPWVRRELVADSYGRGRVYIAGDAAHLMSPTGGFGMNTGIGDAVDLSWKLAAILDGWGGPELLTAYDAERRPVAQRNVAEATRNLDRMLAPRTQRPTPALFEPGADGDRERERYGAWFKDLMSAEWFSLGIHLGYRYPDSPICQGDGTPLVPLTVRDYVQSSQAGGRAPHVWLRDGRSTLDLFGAGFVLLRLGPNPPAAHDIVGAAQAVCVPLTVHDIDEPDVTEAYERGLVLVRPDGHVAWRGDDEPADCDALIARVTGRMTVASKPPPPARTQKGRPMDLTYANQEAISPELALLHEELSRLSFLPGWNRAGSPPMWDLPATAFTPHVWRYADARRTLLAAGDLVSPEFAERRNLILVNPHEGNAYPTTRTQVIAYQMMRPGEHARTHRHAPHAGRLVLEADEGAYTIVNGVRIPMKPGDVLLTPGWYWHGHGHDGQAPALWIDFLDIPLVQLLEPMFFDRYPGDWQEPESETRDSPMIFPVERTMAQLAETGSDPYFGRRVELSQSVMPTIGLYMQRLDPGVATREYRTSANHQYCVVEGSGATWINGVKHEWTQGDVIVVPSWARQYSQSADGATLLDVTDEPLQKYCRYLRTTIPGLGEELPLGLSASLEA